MADSDENEEDQTPDNSGEKGSGLKHKKIGHRRVDTETGLVSYKKIPASGLMEALQLGIGHSIGSITPQQTRDLLMKDFNELDIVQFPADGSATTPAHRCKDFLFKTYAPRAFKKFRKEFDIEADNFLVSLCTDRLKELSNPGASGSLFFLSHDDNFIIKTITRKEAIFLQKLLPGYYLNLTQNKETTLPKFFGSFQYESMGKTIRICVMNNILPSTLKYHEKYDLKGSMFKRQAGHKERVKSSPTLKDLDFLEEHPGGLILEPDLFDNLKKTLERDIRVLESFRIMDYSLLLGVHNLTLSKVETLKSRKPNLETRQYSEQEVGYHHDFAMQMLGRIGSKRIKGDWRTDDSIPHGGTLAVNEKGEQCLIFLGIIDILQSYRFLKKVEHSWKSIITDGDTVSVHRPSFYAERFKNFCFDRVFKRGDESSPQIRRQKSSIRRAASSRVNCPNTLTPSTATKSNQRLDVGSATNFTPHTIEATTDDVAGPSDHQAEYPRGSHGFQLSSTQEFESGGNQAGGRTPGTIEEGAVGEVEGAEHHPPPDTSPYSEEDNLSFNVDKSEENSSSQGNHSELRTVLV